MTTIAENNNTNGLDHSKSNQIDDRADSGVWVSSDSDKNGLHPSDSVFENGHDDETHPVTVSGKLHRQSATERTISLTSSNVSVDCDDYYAKFHDQFLSCNICRRAFNDHTREAKYLPCLHTLCLKCLQGLVNGGATETCCPICKHSSTFSKKDVDGLLTNFHVKQMREYLGVDDEEAVGRRSGRGRNLNGKSRAFLCEGCSKQGRAIGCCANCVRYLCRECITAHQFRKDSEDHDILILMDLKVQERKKLQEQRLYCTMHHRQPMTLFCKGPKCQIPLCQLCADLAHKDTTWHDLTDLTEAADKSRAELRQLIDKSLRQWEPLEQLITNIHTEVDQVSSHASQAETEIAEFFVKRRAELDKREQSLLQAVHDAKSHMEHHLKKQKEAAEMTIASVTAMCNFADVALEEDSQVETVMAMERLKPILNVLSSRDFHTQPLSNSLVTFRHDHNSAEIYHRLAVQDLGKIQTSEVVPFLTKVKTRAALVNLECTFTLWTTDCDGNECSKGGACITAKLTDTKGDSMTCLVQDNLDGSYYIVFTPELIGNHTLQITVCDEPIEAIEVAVCKLSIDAQPATVGNQSIINVKAIDFTSKCYPLAIGMNIKCSLLDPTRRTQECLVQHTKSGTYNVQFTPKKIGNHYLQMLIDDQTPNIGPIDVIVHKVIFLSSPDPTNFFENMRGVVVGNNGHIYVADTVENKQVVEFNGHGQQVRHFPVMYKEDSILAMDRQDITVLFIGKKYVVEYDKLGTLLRKFSASNLKDPIGLAVNSRRDTLILDALQCCVYIYDIDGKVIHKIGRRGTIAADLTYPVAICVDTYNNIFICDKGNHSVLQLDENGVILRQFGNRDTLRHPGSIAVTPDNFLLVHDERLSQVVHVFGMKSCQAVRSIKVAGIAGFREGITVTPDWYFLKIDHKSNYLRKYTYR